MTTVVTEGLYNTYMVVELTSIWTPPCDPVLTFMDFEDTSCAPPQYESVWYDGGYYSPAICPSGYTSGCEPTKTMKPGQTGAICVPSGWECSSFQMHAFSVDGDQTTSVPAFQIRWEADDLSLLETNPLTPAAATDGSDGDSPKDGGSGPKATSGVDGGDGDDSDGGDDSGDGGLPTGAIVGIVVGVALLVAIILISGFMWYRKRYLKQAKSVGQYQEGEKPDAAAGQPPVYPRGPQEMEATQKLAPSGTLQHDTATAAEVHGEPRPSPPIPQLDGVSMANQIPHGTPPHNTHNTTPGNGPATSELYSPSTTMPSVLGGGTYPNAGANPSELHGLHRVPELSPQTATGHPHASPSVAEMHASTVGPAELASGRTGDTNWPSELSGVSRRAL